LENIKGRDHLEDRKEVMVLWTAFSGGLLGTPPVQTGPGAHPASCKMGTGSFPGVKYGRGVLLTTHPLLVPRSWKRVELYLYPPSGLHRACKGITLIYLLGTQE